MMRINLYCPVCHNILVKNGKSQNEKELEYLFSDVYELLDVGIYHTKCSKGHDGIVVVDNLNFELLFDLSINAIVDRYYRESVASATSALERFYEFFIKVAWRVQGIPFEVIDRNWKEMANQSERQLGAYITSYSILFGSSAPIMNDKQKNFRNSVIHKGRIPDREQTIEYAKIIIDLIDEPLNRLKLQNLDIVKEVYEQYAPKYESENQENILTIRYPSIISATESLQDDDCRLNRDIEILIGYVSKNRNMRRLQLGSNMLIEEDADIATSNAISKNNSLVSDNEYKVILAPDISIEDCFDRIQDSINFYEGIVRWIQNDHPQLCYNDIMTVAAANNQINVKLYTLSLKSKVFKVLLDLEPQNIAYRKAYETTVKQLEEYHHNTYYAD